VAQSDGFRDLNTTLQSLIIQLAAQKTVIRDLVQDAHQVIRDQMKIDEQRRAFLNSLYFPDLISRHEQIPEAHEKTFQWIFEPHGELALKWDSFIQWLQAGQGIYWISGKAGSGKSTLMSYISTDPRTRAALERWAQPYRLTIPVFFFWNAGSELQKTTVGLLRSLLFQILDHYPQLIPAVARMADGTQTHASGADNHTRLATWTEKRLQNGLEIITQQKTVAVKICCFIDGLDELEGDQIELLKILMKLQHNNAIKLCLSSRPLKPLEDAFANSAKLKLQDLTASDIEKYVNGKLEALPQMQTLRTRDPELASEIFDRIIQHADGVFLWVWMAVKELAEGLQNEDDEDQLRATLQSLPEELDDFYVQMLKRIKRSYRKEAATYFRLILRDRLLLRDRLILRYRLILRDRLILHEEEISVLGMAYAKSQIVRHSPAQDIDELKPDEISSMCDTMKVHLMTRCAGLLECYDSSTGDAEDSVSSSLSSYAENSMTVDERDQKLNDEEESILRAKAYNHITVTFLHRTARDFLKENETGKAFMSDNFDSELSVCEWYFFAELAKSKWESRRSGHDGLGSVLLELERADAETGVAQTRLMEALDDVMARRYGNVELPERKGSHWALMKIVADRSDSACEYIYDITGFAAYFWLKHTVLNRVNSPEFRDNQAYKDYMFRYALMSLECHRPGEYPDLFVSLLQRGANPNTIVKTRIGSRPTNVTGFEAFLRQLWYKACLLSLSGTSSDYFYMIESLLTIGVDKGLWLTGLKTEDFWRMDHFETNCVDEAKPGTNGHAQGKTTCRDHHEVNIEFSMSVPSVLKMCLGKEPGYERLQAILAEIGGCEKIVLERLHQSLPDRTWTVSSTTATSFQEVADACADHSLKGGRNYRTPPEEVMSVIRKNFDLKNGSGADLKQEE
jgi:hypothetical protein